MAKISFGLGWCRTKAPHLLLNINGFSQMTKLQNMVARDNCVKKITGTQPYNSTLLPAPVQWVKRSYHLRADASFSKFTFCFSNGSIYSGDEAAGTLTARQAGFAASAIPMDMTIQVGGNSILYFFTGEEAPYKFDGNGSYAWEKTTLDADITMGVVHLERAFYIHKNNSNLDYSIATTNPESIEDTILIGNDKDSVNMAIVLGADESFYIFKNNAIYQLYGRTAAQFQVRLVTNKYGLATKRGIMAVGSGFIFLNEMDKELYFFGGTESSIHPLTEDDIRLREIINLTPAAINNVCMTTHKGLFRFAFQHRESFLNCNNAELVYPINEPMPNGLPKWSLLWGSNVLSYSVWTQQGDRTELVTGRSDTGKLMYHERGWDWDGLAMETIARLGEITLSEDMVCKLIDIFIKAKPGSKSVNSLFRYYANGRFSDRGEESQSFKGETRTIGNISLQMSALFNDNISPLEAYARLNSVAFEIYDNNNGTELELYDIAFKFKKLYPIRNQLV